MKARKNATVADKIVGIIRHPNHPMYSLFSVDVTHEQNFFQKDTFDERDFSPLFFFIVIVMGLITPGSLDLS